MGDVDMDNLTLDEEEIEAMGRAGFCEEEALAFKQVYTHYDNNFGKGDGKCSVPLMRSMVRALGIQMSKDDEVALGQMLEDCDENKDGSTQFPEFLLLIAKMQETNFCGMNDAAAEAVNAEASKKQKKEEQQKRKEREKKAHRESSGGGGVYLQEQTEVFEAIAKMANKEDEKKAEKKEEEVGILKRYDEDADGAYWSHYQRHNKDALDNQHKLWRERQHRAKMLEQR